jgi:hypothetical protein
MDKQIQQQIKKTNFAIAKAKEVREKEGFTGSYSTRALMFLVLENQVLMMERLSKS